MARAGDKAWENMKSCAAAEGWFFAEYTDGAVGADRVI